MGGRNQAVPRSEHLCFGPVESVDADGLCTRRLERPEMRPSHGPRRPGGPCLVVKSF